MLLLAYAACTGLGELVRADALDDPIRSRAADAERVLVSTVEMLENAGRPNSGLRVWMIPTANGIVRLQKPPLAYWMAAASFKLFGVHDWAGRLPFALCGWLTVVLTYHIGLSAFAGNTRIGMWSSACWWEVSSSIATDTSPRPISS